MSVNNKKILIFILGIFIIFSLQNVSSLGVTPGRTTVNFEPGLSKQVSFSVVNTENKEFEVAFYVKGELAEYVTLNQVYSSFKAGEASKSFSYSVNLPERIEEPGLHEIEILVLELPKGAREGAAAVGATVAVMTQFHVNVAYPDKHIEAEVNVIKSEGKIIFAVPIFSRGKLDIVNAKAVIDIYTSLNELVATIESDTVGLNSLERKELIAEWDPNVNPGKYSAVVSVIYDNKIVEVEKQFEVGDLLVEILEVNVRDFELGEIAKFNALVQNKWSSDLSDAFLNILVYNSEGEIMADFKSQTYDIAALNKYEMVAYWDTAGVREGTYDGKLILDYGQGSSEKNIELKISQYDLEVVGLTGHVLVKGSGGSLNMNFILILVVAILVVANIIWFVLIKRILKKKKR